MSERTSGRPRGRSGPHRAAGATTTAHRMRHNLPMIGWLWLLWIVLWGKLSALVVLTGLLVAVTVVTAFPLPPITPIPTVRPLATARLLIYLLLDIVGSGLTVAWEAVRPGPRTRTAILEVPLRVDTDLLVTTTAHLTTLTPGTLVLEIDRGQLLLYVHALPARDEQEAEKRRREVQHTERLVARSFAPLSSVRGPEPDRREDQQ